MEKNIHPLTPDTTPTQETEPQLQPKIYAACLAAYNNGHLHGDWIYADQTPDDLQAEILDMLDKSPIPNAEEWAIHDYEGFGAFNLHEYERLDTIARVAGGIALHGAAFAHWIHEVGSDAEDAIETFTDHYQGHWNSMAEYAEQLIDDTDPEPLKDTSQWLRPYIHIDYEALGRDLGHDLTTTEEQHGVHIFDSR